ncbi:MAG: hypothetical protein OK449_10960 [Thaumarchaeota archaeon]|nr:hypothetical protein [Nitrososphaerota archaeon]
MQGSKVLAVLLVTGVLPFITLIPSASAGTITDLTTANGATVCPTTIGGTWNSGTDTCTISGSYTISSGNTLTVDTGVILTISGTGSLTVNGILSIVQLVILDSGGVITVSSTGTINNANGFDISGVVNNHGTINDNDGVIFIEFPGALNDYGTVNENNVDGFSAIHIGTGASFTVFCGGVFNNPPPAVVYGIVTTQVCTANGVPQFPSLGASGGLGLMVAISLLALVATRKSGIFGSRAAPN